jgi:hypothetical protein
MDVVTKDGPWSGRARGEEQAGSCTAQRRFDNSWAQLFDPRPTRLTAGKRLCKDSHWIEKGTPFERKGRKTTGLRGHPMTAGLPNPHRPVDDAQTKREAIGSDSAMPSPPLAGATPAPGILSVPGTVYCPSPNSFMQGECYVAKSCETP